VFTLDVIARLDRAIQYSRDVNDKPRSRGVLDTPHARGMTTLDVIARSEATKQSIVTVALAVDCFASLAMTGQNPMRLGCLKFESVPTVPSSPAKAGDPVF
jgi:ethanolamine utilization microcompartment shell protein EutL